MLGRLFQESLEQFRFEIAVMLFLTGVILTLPFTMALFSDKARSFPARAINAPITEPKAQTIDNKEPASVAAVSPISSASTTWPMRGRVTADFGVPHMPWERRHSGIDIASGSRGGEPITTFKSGRVVDAVRSGRGLGNHVIVDHGNTVTSYYGHMSTIRVRQGQEVKPGDTLGLEGSSGTSTGPHLHFEIRVNGKPVNPRQFISGNP